MAEIHGLCLHREKGGEPVTNICANCGEVVDQHRLENISTCLSELSEKLREEVDGEYL